MNNNGFTLLEILIALGIMSFGFLAMSQMQYLSLRQSNLAESGSVATNIIQFVSDRDISRAKRLHLLNSRVYLEAQSGKVITNQDSYCSDTGAICEDCPCDPLSVFTSDSLTSDTIEIRCAAIDVNNFDPDTIVYVDNATDCKNQVTDTEYYLLRRVINTVDTSVTPNQVDIDVSYAVKNERQLDEASFTSTDDFTIFNSVANQKYRLSAHVDTGWINFVSTGSGAADAPWTTVIVPHIP